VEGFRRTSRHPVAANLAQGKNGHLQYSANGAAAWHEIKES
jgi:hypothetical protein